MKTGDLARPSSAWRPAGLSPGVSPGWEPTPSGLLWIPSRAGSDAEDVAEALCADSSADSSALEFEVDVEDCELDAEDDLDDDLTGAEIDGRYRILEEIGAGGIGVAYRARRLALDREVVVKFLRARFAHRAEFVRRFEREARAMGRLHHAHCVTPIDVGTHDGRPYVVMEYVRGRLLSTILRGRRISTRRAIAIMGQVLAALDHIHRHGIVHRDLKAGNIMLTHDPVGTEQVKILDFGMAKFVWEGEQPTPVGFSLPRSASVSVDGVVVGTPSVMAPEQIRQHPVDGRADLYAAGVLMYQMITGTRPFRHPDVEGLLRMHLHTAPVPPRMSARAWATSPKLERAILRALAKDPRDRFSSALEMRRAIEDTPEGRGIFAGALERRARRASLQPLAARCRNSARRVLRAIVRTVPGRLRSLRLAARARLRAAAASIMRRRQARPAAALTDGAAAFTDGATSDRRAGSRPRTPSR